MSEYQIFSEFCDNLTINNKSDISLRYQLITNRLNLDFYGYQSYTDHSLYVGSYGRGTAIHGISDLDMIFVLPPVLLSQYTNYIGNGQSALLQRVRNSLLKTYPRTSIGGDGQVVVVSFSDGMVFEVVPSFAQSDTSYKYPDSNNGGRWRTTNPKPEIAAIQHYPYSENLKWLCRMTRAWKNNRNVPMGGLLIDTLAHKFICNWEYRDKGKGFYDWMCRDFFAFLADENPSKAYWLALGSNQFIHRKGGFEYKAKLAYNKSSEAIESQNNKYWYTAKAKWREIFGNTFPC
jgi:hypothetical protein